MGDDQSILALEYQWAMISPFWPWNISGQWSVHFGPEISVGNGQSILALGVSALLNSTRQAVWVSGLLSGRLGIRGNEGPNLPVSDVGHRSPYSHVL